jgi:KaiC/GvpD/RAD55 family RecA-like ATPase
MQRTRPARSTAGGRLQCSFCGYEIPASPIRRPDGTPFCSERCRDAYGDGDEPFADRFGFKQFVTGVNALDALLPWGVPSNSFVLLAGQDGIRHRGLQTELVWRALTRDESAIIITFVVSPVAVVEHFLTFGWNVLPYLESGQLRIVDCFTNRLREEHQSPDRRVPWSRFLDGFLEDAVTIVRDTTNLRSVENDLLGALDEREMAGSGVVVIDSLNEVSLQGNELQTEQFIKEVRADVCDRLFVPIFASTTISEEGTFVQEHAYLFDGIVDMMIDENAVPGVRLKRISVRKMDGVQYFPHWAAYENTGYAGFRTYDPRTELDAIYGYGGERARNP